MGRITELNLRNLKGRASEKVGGKGDGVLLFERRSWGAVEVYYRYRLAGGDNRIKIGDFSQKGFTGLNLRQCREMGAEMSANRRAHPNLKEWLEMNQVERERKEQKALRAFQIEQQKGTLSDLVTAYHFHLKRQGKESADKAKYLLEHYVIKPFPNLAKTKAAEITADHVVMIIRKMLSDGVTTTANRVRTFLMAAFNYARHADHDPMQMNDQGKRFDVVINPVEAVPRQAQFERVRERVLTKEELRGLWHDFDNTPNVGPLMGLLVRLIIALGGQRPKQLLACRWSDYDFERGYVTITDTKGRTSKPRKHVVPLTDRALAILEEVRVFTGDLDWPFSINGQAPYTAHAVSVGLGRYLKYKYGLVVPESEKFLFKDVRRTCKQLMVDAGISRESRNLLQHHALTGIDYRHYDHSDHLAEKRDALYQFDAHLEQVLTGVNRKAVKLRRVGQC